MGDGREGDWECLGCSNRNYALRSFCNRCKQPRLFMDSNTSPNSKWLPRIGDWICTGYEIYPWRRMRKRKQSGDQGTSQHTSRLASSASLRSPGTKGLEGTSL